MDECFHSSKGSGATHAGALTRPHGGNFTHSRIEILRRLARTLPSARWRHPQRQRHSARGDYDLYRQLGVTSPPLLQQRTSILDQSPPTTLAGAPSHLWQAKTPTVSTRVTPSRDQASAGLMLIPTKARGLLSGTMIRGTLTRGLNRPQDAKTCVKQSGPREPTVSFRSKGKERTQRGPLHRRPTA